MTMYSEEHEAFRNMPVSAVAAYLDELIENREFGYLDLSPEGLLSRIAACEYHLYTYYTDTAAWVWEAEFIAIHPFSSLFVACAQRVGYTLDPDNPMFTEAVVLAKAISEAIWRYIETHGDGYVFYCGGNQCAFQREELAVAA